MAYIGREPVTGNFVKLDSITVVNGQAAYTMNNGGSAFTDYDNVNQFLVSLNGVLQAPTDSFTVSGSTLTFASNLSTGDVIDFVIVLGNTLDIGTPSDNTVSLAKLTASGTKDATTFLRGDNTFASAGGTNTPSFQAYLSSNQTVVSGTETKIEFDTEDFDTANAYDNSTNYRFTPQTAGKYFVYATVRGNAGTSSLDLEMTAIYKNGSSYIENQVDYRGNDALLAGIPVSAIVDMNGSSDYLECFARCLGGTTINGSSTRPSVFGAYKIIE